MQRHILIVGNGAREYSLGMALASEDVCLYFFPGNGATQYLGMNIAPQNNDELIAFIQSKNISLVVIGPEAPLSEGLSDILRKENIDFKSNNIIYKEVSFIDSAIPSWIPNHINYVSKLHDETKPITKKEFKELLLMHFKYLKKHPYWIQEPYWIIDKKPLIFAGQIDVTLLHHDTTYLYIFFNPKDNSYEYLTQSM